MIKIDEYIKHTDNLKEMGLLSEDFRIIQYKDGDLLAVDGKCEAFENKPIDNKDYIWWYNGTAFSYDENYSNYCKHNVAVFGEDGTLELRASPPFGFFNPLLSIPWKGIRRDKKEEKVVTP